MVGVLSYIAIQTFVFQSNEINSEIFALLTMMAMLGIIGLTDDLLGWKKGGLSIKFRLFFTFLASISLIVINAGSNEMNVPFLGLVNLGLFYPFFIVPLGIIGATTTYNMLAGFNGLEAGQGIIILSFLSFVAYKTGSPWLSIIGLCMVATLIVFYFYNKVPAKVFPGDILTYSIGALVAGMAILGNFEKIALFVFMLYGFETVLKLRGNLKKQSFGIPNKDNSLEMPYQKIYGMTHFSLWILKKFKKKVYEKDVTRFIFGLQIFICLSALVIFRQGIF